MTVTFDRKSLLRAAHLASSVAPRNTPRVCLNGLHLSCRGSVLTVKGTDTEVTIACTVQGEGESTWEALPLSGKFVAFLAESTDEQITLTKVNDTLEIRTAFGEVVLQDVDSPDVYPASVNADPEKVIVLPVEELLPALKRVSPFAAKESARYALTGVRIERLPGQIILIATDGKRMAVEEMACPSSELVNGDFIIPLKTVKAIESACKGEGGEITMGFTKSTVHVSVDDTTIDARLLEGRYPTWPEVFPRRIDHKIPMNTGSLLSLTRQASVMTDEDTRGIDYTFDQSTLTASCKQEAGKAKIQMPVAFEGSHTVTLAGDLMASLLNLWPGDTELTMKLVEKNTVCCFDVGANYRAVIVPLTRGNKE